MSAVVRALRRVCGAPLCAALSGAALLVGTTALAQSSGGGFELRPWALGSGGGRATGGGHVLEGTLGQPDAGALQSGGSYQLTGGLHRRVAPEPGGPLLADGFEGP